MFRRNICFAPVAALRIGTPKCRKSGDNPFCVRGNASFWVAISDDSLGWNINRIRSLSPEKSYLPGQADVGPWDDGVVGNGSPDLRFDLIGGGLADARSDARDPIEPRKIIFKIRRGIIFKMTANFLVMLWARSQHQHYDCVMLPVSDETRTDEHKLLGRNAKKSP